MKHLFIFAHPDDETVACAGTLRQLVEAGQDVCVVSVTDGGGGEVSPAAASALAQHGSVSQLRRTELAAALRTLGVTRHQVLNFPDGQITNQMTWGSLRSRLIDLIDEYRPDFVYTFDHSGWYFHLDHVATSIATTWAVQEAKYPPAVFFLVHFRVRQTKWRYVYSPQLPVTHQVAVTTHKPQKLAALAAHQSQQLAEPVRQIESEAVHHELFQLVSATPQGQAWIAQLPFFAALPA